MDKIASWARDSVSALASWSVIKGMDDGNFSQTEIIRLSKSDYLLSLISGRSGLAEKITIIRLFSPIIKE
jgi:hypothetical protein